uniref:Uncharacterized protein n=1 Tax=Arundo donax TaxID=35708 RepID=A0A0A9DWY1_ARUDO
MDSTAPRPAHCTCALHHQAHRGLRNKHTALGHHRKSTTPLPNSSYCCDATTPSRCLNPHPVARHGPNRRAIEPYQQLASLHWIQIVSPELLNMEE